MFCLSLHIFQVAVSSRPRIIKSESDVKMTGYLFLRVKRRQQCYRSGSERAQSGFKAKLDCVTGLLLSLHFINCEDLKCLSKIYWYLPHTQTSKKERTGSIFPFKAEVLSVTSIFMHNRSIRAHRLMESQKLLNFIGGENNVQIKLWANPFKAVETINSKHICQSHFGIIRRCAVSRISWTQLWAIKHVQSFVPICQVDVGCELTNWPTIQHCRPKSPTVQANSFPDFFLLPFLPPKMGIC